MLGEAAYGKKNHLQLVNDVEIARLLSVSRSWVRKQRFLRRHGLPHVFDIDPVMIGSLPRYRLEDVRAWISAREPSLGRS